MDIDQMIEKWQDILACAEDWTEKNLAQEVLDDLGRL